jgi:hypothetical protein
MVGLLEDMGRQPRIAVATGLECWFGKLWTTGILGHLRDVCAGRNQHTEHQGDGVKSKDAHGFLRGSGRMNLWPQRKDPN